MVRTVVLEGLNEENTCAWITHQYKSQTFLPEIGALPDGRFDLSIDSQHLGCDIFQTYHLQNLSDRRIVCIFLVLLALPLCFRVGFSMLHRSLNVFSKQ